MRESGLSKATFPASAAAKDFFSLLREARHHEWQVIADQMPAKGMLVAADTIDTDVGSIREQYVARFQALLGEVQLSLADIALLVNCRPDLRGELSLTFSPPSGLRERLCMLLRAAGASSFSELLPSNFGG